MPDWKFAMFYQGEFSRPAGLIYEDYFDTYRENGGHLVKPFDLPASWPRHVGIDFGAVNTALMWLARDPQADVYYAYRESLEGSKSTPQHAAAARELAKGVNLRTWDGGAKSETQQRMDWKAAGVSVREPFVSDVEAGIDRVIGLFKNFRLYVFDNLKGLRDELGTYGRKVDDAGQVTDDIKDKETFHRLDALRYVVQGATHSGLPFGFVAQDKVA